MHLLLQERGPGPRHFPCGRKSRQGCRVLVHMPTLCNFLSPSNSHLQSRLSVDPLSSSSRSSPQKGPRLRAVSVRRCFLPNKGCAQPQASGLGPARRISPVRSAKFPKLGQPLHAHDGVDEHAATLQEPNLAWGKRSRAGSMSWPTSQFHGPVAACSLARLDLNQRCAICTQVHKSSSEAAQLFILSHSACLHLTHTHAHNPSLLTWYPAPSCTQLTMSRALAMLCLAWLALASSWQACHAADCVQETGYDYSGGDLSNGAFDGINNAQACCNKCATNWACRRVARVGSVATVTGTCQVRSMARNSLLAAAPLP